MLSAFRRDAVESWHRAMQTGAKYGRHAPAKDWLVATGTITSQEPADRLTIWVGDGTSPPPFRLPEVPACFRDMTAPEQDNERPALAPTTEAPQGTSIPDGPMVLNVPGAQAPTYCRTTRCEYAADAQPRNSCLDSLELCTSSEAQNRLGQKDSAPTAGHGRKLKPTKV
jgi:hypothetical protein